MRALLLAVLLANLSLLVSVLFPGVAIRLLFGEVGTHGRRTGDWVIEALAIGSIWATAQFLFLYGVFQPALALDAGNLLIVKYAIDLGVILFGSFRSRKSFRRLAGALAELARTLVKPVNSIGIAVAVAIGSYAVFQFPYARDNSALYWLAAAVSNPGTALNPEQAPAYVAWIYWPTLVAWPQLAASTIGAGAKIALHLLTFFAIKRLCYISPITSRPWIPPVLYVLSLVSAFGDFGLLNSGKATLFGIAFLFAAMATLISGRERPDTDATEWGFASLMALAIGFSATAVPYGLVFLALFLALASPMPSASRLLLRTGIMASVPTVVTLGTILRLPFWIAAILCGLLLAVLFASRRRIDQGVAGWHRWVEGRRAQVEWAVLGILMASVILMLPFDYAACSRPPLDGTVSFADMFLFSKSNWPMPQHVGFLAFAGFLSVMLARRQGPGRTGIVALICFPFAVLVPVLLVARSEFISLPFHPQKLWDLAKNVPTWCWGIIANYFALLLTLQLCERAVGSRFRRSLPTILVTVLLAAHFVGLVQNRRLPRLARWNVAPHFTSTGGNRMAELAFFSEAILQTLGAEPQQQTPTVYVDQSTTEAGHYWELLGTGVAVVGGSSSKGEFRVNSVLGDELVDASRERVTFLIANRAAVQAWWETGKPGLVVTELGGFPERDSLFLVEQSSDRRKPGLTLKRLPPVTPSNPDFQQVFSSAR